jgi:hypothetical protein
MAPAPPHPIVDGSTSAPTRGTTMHATVHTIDGIPGPQDTSWVDAVLTALRSGGVPAGALVCAAMGTGPGTVVALWDDERDAARARTGAVGPAGAVALGAARAYQIDFRRAGVGTGRPRYLQLLTFDGPRSAEWSAAYDRAGEHRIWPATRDLPGLVEVFGGHAPDGARFAVTVAESVEALEAAGIAIMSTELLPGEDPAQLTGPDSMAVLRLLHADLPVGADR